uniref:Aspartate aminotransferase n=1 Tax=Neobodo designis TaxID=312471 RepID=A0A7S1MS63_NEODS|mmetsp:Transcript_46195/g.142441  ORF Transcript_46195/g.142441 Transcript_46195/m.142441 type:complete len:422 (+) Transcript_46195:245-1510(+)|eukprot:CAMPEP_0174856390 /NCGR_PEP_ID=MMETSP1114-20130205/35818_1 /TAXON_ID=312471 /ORGANISM="Neobodo designis, Strain CCAP 1951/1" /LENGTH=421 /DNA_ID=CAMNT_0016091185 /DNA_START=243 /DNA_END=1508 /DNA_ORIENTATION=+
MPVTQMYDGLPIVPDDKIFKTSDWYRRDKNPKKMFLSIGAYRDANGNPYVLNVVKKAEQIYQANMLEGRENKEYDTIDGYKPFRDASVKMLLGDDCPALDYIASSVGLSGTGTLRVAAAFLATLTPKHTHVYVSNPTWANHLPIFQQAGFHNLKEYRYFNKATNGLDYQGMCDDLWNAPDQSVVILHLCGHNPTGVDPTPEQWQRLCDLCKLKRFYVIFDSAYQGYASGDLDRDAFGIRLFARNKVEFIACQSYAKNMGLYGDRLGCLSVVCNSKESANRVARIVKAKCIRPLYSCPPRRPARVGALVLTDPTLRREWEEELKEMSERIKSMRTLLYNELRKRNTPGKWTHIIDQIGMFSYLGLTEQQCQRLIRDYSIYMLTTGRISMAGLNVENCPRLAQAMHEVITNTGEKSKKFLSKM